MLKKANAQNQTEELSHLLDAINSGHQPDCADPELTELLDVAAWVQENSASPPPPQHILNQIVDRTLADRPQPQSGKFSKRRLWLYSGGLGSVAAMLLVAALNLLPSSSLKSTVPDLAPPPPSAPAKPQSMAAEDAPPATPPAALPEQPPTPATVPAPSIAAAPPPVKIPAPESSPALNSSILPPATAPDLNSVPLRAARENSAPAMKSHKSLFLADENILTTAVPPDTAAYEAAAPAALALTPLSLPGKIPDLVINDPDAGMIRQIFFRGTPQEVTVTQQWLTPPDRKKTYGSGQKADRTAINRIQLQLFGQEVTVEGNQPPAELERLARSLKP